MATGVGQSILWSVWSSAGQRLGRLDADAVVIANRSARRDPLVQWLIGWLAERLAVVEVVLMGLLMLAGHRRGAVRMLLGVACVYASSEASGALWRRQRPFAARSDVVALVEHGAGRSFPSRHTASALAMGIVGGRAHPRLGGVMIGVGGVLALSRLAAGLHYPSDLVGGAVLGAVVGRLLR